MNTKVDISAGNVHVQTDGNLTVSASNIPIKDSVARQTVHGLEIHEITGDELKALKKKLRYQVSKEYGMYIVQEGDTLSHIGEGTGHSWRTLAQLNNLENPHLIFPGQVIKLR
jgi:nucleoid-associated protein YgaU